MKNIILASIFLLSTVALAEGTPATAPKMSKGAAKAECLKENKDLKGVDLKKCIKSKLG